MFGIQVFGSHGLIQIDQDFLCLTLKASGTGVGQDHVVNGFWTTEIEVSAIMPVITLRVPPTAPNAALGQGITTLGRFRRNGNWVFVVMTNGSYAVAPTFQYWIYDKAPNTTPTGFGFWLRRENGDTAFRSDLAILDSAIGPGQALAVRSESTVSFNENWNYDSQVQREYVYYEYGVTLCFIRSTPTESVEYVYRQIDGGFAWDRAPEYDLPVSGSPGHSANPFRAG